MIFRTLATTCLLISTANYAHAHAAIPFVDIASCSSGSPWVSFDDSDMNCKLTSCYNAIECDDEGGNVEQVFTSGLCNEGSGCEPGDAVWCPARGSGCCSCAPSFNRRKLRERKLPKRIYVGNLP